MIIDAHSSSGTGGGTNVRSNSYGEFTLEKLPTGKYEISIQPPPDSNLKAESISFDLVDQDVSGLVIKATTGASLSGVVVLERTRDRNNIGPAPAWLSVYWRSEAQGYSYSSNGSTPIKPDGTFHVGGLTAGTVGFSVGACCARRASRMAQTRPANTRLFYRRGASGRGRCFSDRVYANGKGAQDPLRPRSFRVRADLASKLAPPN